MPEPRKGLASGLWNSKKYAVALIWWGQCSLFAAIGLAGKSPIVVAASLLAGGIVLAGFQIGQGIEDGQRGQG